MGNSKHQNVDFDKLKLGEATGLTLDPQNLVKSSQPKEIPAPKRRAAVAKKNVWLRYGKHRATPLVDPFVVEQEESSMENV